MFHEEVHGTTEYGRRYERNLVMLMLREKVTIDNLSFIHELRWLGADEKCNSAAWRTYTMG